MQPEKAFRFGKTRRRVHYVKMDSGHAHSSCAVDIAELIIHKHAVLGAQAEVRDQVLVGLSNRFQCLGVGRVMNDIDFWQKRQLFAESGSVE